LSESRSNSKWRKAIRILVFVIAIFAGFLFVAHFRTPDLFSVTEESFTFDAYPTDNGDGRLALQEALRKLFPPGTAKAHVDSVLLAKKTEQFDMVPAQHFKHVLYRYVIPSSYCKPLWNVYVDYDQDMKLIKLSIAGVWGSCGL
jgi:hypothetical protein